MRIKSCPVRIKAAGENEGTDDGVFEAIVAAYNVDSVGDKIMPGAFGETLDEWKSSGNPIPVLWSHMSHDPDYHIGEVLEAEERPEGLWVKARIDLDSPKAAQVYKLLKGRRVTQFSFAYDVLDGGPAKSKAADDPDADSFELRKLKLYEVGPTLIGANQATELLDVKSADGATMRVAVEGASAAQTEELRQALSGAMAAKAGRTLSQKNEQRVRDIAKLAKELLDSLSSSTDDDEKATPVPPETPSPQPAAKEAPAGPSPASLRQRETDRLDRFEVEALTTLSG
ncbi:HK97 family phage prohead protease [Streptomyces sp. NRRL S-15]|uniref:HK97 family phage prohead protease n=1 Tax=Streptomyces sp. NRRL S-15 TaxID=1463886 RepID=UPI00068F2E74|nr:HK97 family phage prohead protease [Streptomyces sp. NRRL S-15]